MKKIIPIMALALAGCDPVVPLYPKDLEYALRVCAANEGIQRIELRSDMTLMTVFCKNGATFKRTRGGYQ